MNYTVFADGCYTLTAGSARLIGCYPAIDGVSLHPVSVETRENRITYHLVDNTITLEFCEEADSISLKASMDRTEAHDFSFFHGAKAVNAEKAYAQGFGLGGPSGFHDLCEKVNFTSEALTAISGQEGALAFFFPDQSVYRNSFSFDNNTFSADVFLEGTYDVDRPMPVLKLIEGPSFDNVLKRAAQQIGTKMKARPAEKPAFHWCSWYYLYHNLTQKILEDYLKGFSQYKEEIPFTHIQIDAGYFPSCGDWLLPNERFPEGLKHAAETILKAGYEPGIWIGPYMVGDGSELYKEHPDWILYDVDGKPVRPWIQYNEPKPWGYADSDYFVLDVSHPDAMDYIVNVFRTLHSWGYTLFKTDFLLWGIQDSAKVRRHTPGKTSFEYFRALMTNIREAIGDSRWLGCIAPFMPSVGFVDMMRIAGDVGAQWEDEGFGPTNMIRELTADQYFNQVYWQNDPDAVMIRDFHLHLTESQVQALALLAALCGGCVYTSDPIHEISESRRELLKFIRPDQLTKPIFPKWGSSEKTALVVHHLSQGSLVFWFNPVKDDAFEPVNWSDLVLDGETFVYEYQGEKCNISDLPYVKIPGKSGRLFFVSKEELTVCPKNLWKW